MAKKKIVNKSLIIQYCKYLAIFKGFLMFFVLSFSNIYAEQLINNNSLQSLTEQKQGIEFLREIFKTNKVIKDIEISSYISNLGHKLTQYSYDKDINYGFFLLQDSSINAFAGPYGYIGIHTGLLLASEHEAELAAVLTHEIAHITQRHLLRYQTKIEDNNILLGAGILASIFIKNSELSQAIIGSTIAGVAQRSVNFTREHEVEADRVGSIILSKAQFNPRGMIAFFTKLKDEQGAIEYIRTHPLSINRMTAVLQTIPINTSYNYKDSFIYKVIKAKLYYKIIERVNPTNDKKINLYINAYDLFIKQEYKEAKNTMQKLLKLNQSSTSYILYARILSANNEHEQAIKYLTPLINNDNFEPIIYYLAQIYQNNKELQKAINLLRITTKTKQVSYLTYDLLAELFVANKQVDRYHLAKSYSLVRQGNYKDALIHLKQASAITSDNDFKDITDYNLTNLTNNMKLLDLK